MPAPRPTIRSATFASVQVFHGLTPETETRCFYFWSTANVYRQNDPEATEQPYREIAPTFLEDNEMVEAHRQRLDEVGEQGLVDIASDANRMHMRRIVCRATDCR